MKFAELSAVREVHCLLKVWHAASLRPCLKDSTGALQRFGEFLAILDRQPAWLFAINVLAGLGCHHRCGCVPSIARGNQNRVNVLAVQELAKIAIGTAILISIALID